MARHGFFYDTPGDEVHLGYYRGGRIRPEKQTAVKKLRQEHEDKAGFGSYGGWLTQNHLNDDDYSYIIAYEHKMMLEDLRMCPEVVEPVCMRF
jgi:hypothetical protein